MIRGGGVGPGGQKKAHAATPRGGREDPRGGVSVSSRGGWGPAAGEKRLRPHRAADVKIRGAVSASVRGGGGAPRPGKSGCGHAAPRAGKSAAAWPRPFAAGGGGRRPAETTVRHVRAGRGHTA